MPKSPAVALGPHRANLSVTSPVWMGDMRLFALPMESESVSDVAAEISPVDGAQRARFLAAARPRLDHVYRLAGVPLGNATEAEDAVQDALAVAWQGFDRLREPERFGAWLSYPQKPVP